MWSVFSKHFHAAIPPIRGHFDNIFISDVDWKQLRILKHTATLFALSDHDILSREWRVIVDQDQSSWWAYGAVISQVWLNCWFWKILYILQWGANISRRDCSKLLRLLSWQCNKVKKTEERVSKNYITPTRLFWYYVRLIMLAGMSHSVCSWLEFQRYVDRPTYVRLKDSPLTQLKLHMERWHCWRSVTYVCHRAFEYTVFQTVERSGGCSAGYGPVDYGDPFHPASGL